MNNRQNVRLVVHLYGMKFPKIGSLLSGRKQVPSGFSEDTVIRFDPETQTAVIRSSICTGEKVAGFKNKKDGHFTEVMLIRSPEDEKIFKETYGVETIRTEY